MRRRLLILSTFCLGEAARAQLPKFDDLAKEVGKLPGTTSAGATKGAGDDKTNVAGIKEALAVGTENAVKSLSRPDGYFGNAAVKILIPSSLQKVADMARKIVTGQTGEIKLMTDLLRHRNAQPLPSILK